MKKLKSRLVEPAGGWRYTQKETGWSTKQITFFMLVRAVAQHRANMKLPTPGDLAAEIENAICQSLSPESQIEMCDDGESYTKSVHWGLVDRFLKTMTAFVVGKVPLVPQEEAERRAAICVKCPLNVGLHGCAMCRMTLNALRESVAKRTTTQDSVLQACGVCGCDNRTQVHFPLESLHAGSGDLKYPEWCWKRPASQS